MKRSSLKVAGPGDMVLIEISGEWFLVLIFSMDSEGMWLHGAINLSTGTGTLRMRVPWDVIDCWYKAIEQKPPVKQPTLEAK